MRNKELLCLLYETSLKMLETIEKLSIENGMLDTQEYLTFQDNLNLLSLDPDRN